VEKSSLKGLAMHIIPNFTVWKSSICKGYYNVTGMEYFLIFHIDGKPVVYRGNKTKRSRHTKPYVGLRVEKSSLNPKMGPFLIGRINFDANDTPPTIPVLDQVSNAGTGGIET